VADKVLRDLLNEVDSDKHLAGGTATVSALLEAYIADRESTLSPSTLTLYRRSSRRVASTPLGARKLSKVTPLDVDNAYRELRGQDVSEHSLRQVHQLRRSSFRQGIRWRQIGYNPATDARTPRVARKRVQAPSPENVRALIAHIAKRDVDLAGVLMLACSTGLRRGALCGLQWGDLEGDQLVIRRSLARVDRDVHVRPPKMRAAGEVETVALVPGERALLGRIREMQDGRRRAAGLDPVGPDGWVLSEDGVGERPRRPDSMAGKMWRASVELGIEPKISPHDLRHFAATQMVAAGIDRLCCAPAPSQRRDDHARCLQPSDRSRRAACR
jgi:integrase